MLKAIIVDDEAKSRENLKILIIEWNWDQLTEEKIVPKSGIQSKNCF